MRVVFLFFQGLWTIENHSISNFSKLLDLKVSLSISVIYPIIVDY